MTQYDKIGSAYERVKELPLARFAEVPTVLRSLEHIKGQRVLDLACGTGYYTRRIRELGAAEVVGVDISQVMIRHAVEVEAHLPLGISYQVLDATELPALGGFDRVNAVYLLNYAPNEESLRKMVDGVSRNLKAGGSFFAATTNPDFSFEGVNATKYGATFRSVRLFDAGREVLVELHVDPPVVFTCYTLWREVYERVLLDTGFCELSWIPQSVPDATIAQFRPGHWDDWLANPPVVGLSARWPGSAIAINTGSQRS